MRSLKLFLLGLVLWPVFINVVGFISPFWAIFMLDDAERGLELLHTFQPYVPLFSILFSASLVLLSKVDKRLWVKISCWVVATIYVACSIYGFFPKDDIIYSTLSGISYSLDIVMLFLAGIILLRILGSLPETAESNANVV